MSNKELSEDVSEINFLDPEEVVDFEDAQNEVEEEDFEPQDNETPYTDSLRELSTTEYIAKKEEDTRGNLAMVYTVATFTIFVLGFFVAVLDGLIRKASIIENLTTILPLISGIFLGSLGFVIGYYFRRSDEKDR